MPISSRFRARAGLHSKTAPFRGPRRRNDAVLKSDEAASDRFREFLGSAEGNLFARLDRDRLAGSKVAARARGALADAKSPKSHDADTLALLQMACDPRDEVSEKGLGLLLRHVLLVSNLGRQILQGDGGWTSFLRQCRASFETAACRVKSFRTEHASGNRGDSGII